MLIQKWFLLLIRKLLDVDWECMVFPSKMSRAFTPAMASFQGSSIILCAFAVNRWRKAAQEPRSSSETNDGPGTSLREDANSDDGSSCPPLLPKHKIFLSHSGKQKWFVEKLCEDLEARYRFPFFDRRPSSLPKGERFPKLILEGAKQCEMAVVVVSEEFLTSKWPMIELTTFVRALSGSNPGLKILPLFFGMTVNDLGSHSKQRVWSKVWKQWARDDPRIKLADLEEALKVMRTFNGMVFNGDMNNVWSYERDVVENICSVVRADVKCEDSDVQGRATICKATRERMKVIEPSENGVRVFGYYGMGGIGKTTMCKTLCIELSNEFSGKVCHVELGGTRSVEQMLKEVLKKLTNTSEQVLKRLDEDECRNILKNPSFWRQRTFLAIDNVWGDHKSMEQAEMFMKDSAFYGGSVVMVTSRCGSTLRHVGIEESHCFEVPELGEEDARKLFLYHVAGGKQFGNDGDNVVIDECIARCRFRKSETQGYHYLPLALKVLGVHLRRCGPSPAKWLEDLPEVKDFNRFEGGNPVFSIIRLNYDRLSVQLQALFMDIAVFIEKSSVGSLNGEYVVDGYFGRLSGVHRQKLQDTERQLQQLKERGLLEDVDMESKKVSMHDLYQEFAKMEAEGKLNSSEGLNNRKWVYEVGSDYSDLERTPSGGCWENLIRMHLDTMGDGRGVLNLEGIQWRYFSNLVVLRLRIYGVSNGVLNLEGLRCLRSLTLSNGNCDRKDGGYGGSGGYGGYGEYGGYGGYGGYYAGCAGYAGYAGYISLGQLPASLRILVLGPLNVCLGSDMFDHCTNLLELSLCTLEVSGRIDLRQCTSLESVYLSDISRLQTLLVPSKLQSSLRLLGISWCRDLSVVLGLGDLDRLHRLELGHNHLLEVPDLQNVSNLQIVTIDSCKRDVEAYQFAKICGLDKLEQLREICFRGLDARELPNLNALKYLHTLSLQKCKKLTHLEGVEGLTALRCVDLIKCSSLSRLPDLSNSTKLESLFLSKSGIELHEEDIDMLASLPVLRLVNIGTSSNSSALQEFDLDPVRRKVLISSKHYTWPYTGVMVEERDLETLPIELRSYGY